MINEVFCEQKKNKKNPQAVCRKLPRISWHCRSWPGNFTSLKNSRIPANLQQILESCSKSTTDNAGLQQRSRDIAGYICLQSLVPSCLCVFSLTFLKHMFWSLWVIFLWLMALWSIEFNNTKMYFCVHLVSNELRRYICIAAMKSTQNPLHRSLFSCLLEPGEKFP